MFSYTHFHIIRYGNVPKRETKSELKGGEARDGGEAGGGGEGREGGGEVEGEEVGEGGRGGGGGGSEEEEEACIKNRSPFTTQS
jgi:hypothetical protein